jgi:hypothetical protein
MKHCQKTQDPLIHQNQGTGLPVQAAAALLEPPPQFAAASSGIAAT